MLNGLFINSSSVSGSPIRLNNSQYLRSRNFLNTSDENVLRVNSLDQIEFYSIPYVDSLGRVALLSDITDYSGQIAALQLAVGNLETDVNTLEGQVATLQSQMTIEQGYVASLQSDVNILQTDLNTVELDVAALELLQGTYLLLNGTRSMTGTLDMGSHKVSNVVDPTLSQDAATKAYVDSVVVDLGPLTARVVVLESDVATLQGEMITVQGEIITLQSNVATLQIEMLAAQGDITYLYTNLGEVNTASNVGTAPIGSGTGIFKQKTGTDLEFKSISPGASISVVSGVDDITISYTGIPGEVNTASNVGAGDGVFKQKTGADLEFKTLIAGTNVTITDGTDDVTISAAAGAPIFDKYTYSVSGAILVDTDFILPYSAIAYSCNAYIVTGPMMTEGTDYLISGMTFTLLASSNLIQSLGMGDFVVVQYCVDGFA